MDENLAGVTPDTAPRGLRSPGRRLDPWASWRRHWVKIPILGALVLAVGLPLAWVGGRSEYYAEAAIRVSPAYIENLDDQGDIQLASATQYAQFVQQQVSTIRSYEVALAALRRLGASRGLWQKPDESERRAAERLMGALIVRAVRDTYLVTIGLQGPESAGLAEIVNEVAAAYLEQASEEGLFGSDARVSRLSERREQLQTEIDANVGRLSQLSEELGVSTFDDAQLNPLDRSLSATREALAEWRQRRLAAEARLSALRAAQEREKTLEVESAAREMLPHNPALASATRLHAERRGALLIQLSGLSAEHPGYRAIQRQLEEADRELERITDGELAALETMLQQRRATKAAEELSRAELEVEHARQIETQLSGDYAGQQDRVVAWSTKYQTAVDLSADTRRARKRIDAIRNRIDSITLEAQAPGFVRLVTPARIPEQPISGGRRTLAILVLLLAIGVALLAPIGLDHFDPRILVPGDLEKLLGFAPLAWIACGPEAQTARLAREQIRRLAVYLDREGQRLGSARIALVSVQSGYDAKPLSVRLAAELAELGRRVCRVDSGACPAPDLAVRLSGAATRDCDLWLLAGPPLPESAEAELWAQAADIVVMIVPARTAPAREVLDAARMVERLRPPVVAAVLTEVCVADFPRTFGTMVPRALSNRPRPATNLSGWLWA